MDFVPSSVSMNNSSMSAIFAKSSGMRLVKKVKTSLRSFIKFYGSSANRQDASSVQEERS